MKNLEDIAAYLQFARTVSEAVGEAQFKADLLEQAVTDFGLRGTSGQVRKPDGRILLISFDQKKCFEISPLGRVKYAGYNTVTCDSISPQIINNIGAQTSLSAS